MLNKKGVIVMENLAFILPVMMLVGIIVVWLRFVQAKPEHCQEKSGNIYLRFSMITLCITVVAFIVMKLFGLK